MIGYISVPEKAGGIGVWQYGSRSVDSGDQVSQVVSNITSAGATGASLASSVAGASIAVPIIGAAIAGVSVAIGLFLNRKKPKQKIATSQMADEVERYMRDNVDAWQKSNKTASEQAIALQNFDVLWGQLYEYCSNESLGSPGRNCINERKPGGKWDWFARYRDVIKNDPDVVSDREKMSSGLDSFTSSLVSEDGKTIAMMVVIGALLYYGLNK